LKEKANKDQLLKVVTFKTCIFCNNLLYQYRIQICGHSAVYFRLTTCACIIFSGWRTSWLKTQTKYRFFYSGLWSSDLGLASDCFVTRLNGYSSMGCFKNAAAEEVENFDSWRYMYL